MGLLNVAGKTSAVKPFVGGLVLIAIGAYSFSAFPENNLGALAIVGIGILGIVWALVLWKRWS